jgi:fibronectin-binding autotransporter adhesin
LFAVGQAIAGTNITTNTYITAITGNTLTLSQNIGGTAVAAGTTLTPYNSISAQTTGSVNTLHLAGNGAALSLSAGETLSINGVLRTGHTNNVFSGINGGTGIQTVASGGELVIRTDLSTDTLFISTPILNNGGSSLTKTGAGTLNFSAINTYTGNTYVNAGTLTGSSTSFLGSSANVIVQTGATILPPNSTSFTQLTLNGGTLNATNGSTGIAGTVTLASNTTSLLTSGGTATISANIGGSGNLMVNTNSRQLYLTGNNNYSGTTTLLTPVGTGAVVFGTPGSLYNGDTTKWTPGNITVASGAAMGIRGGNGTTTGFTSAQVSTLLGNMATSNGNGNGLLAGSNVFFDANGGFNYSGAITDSTGSSGGAVGVAVYGSTMTLSGPNTYSGPTVFRPYNTGGVGISVSSFNSVNNGNPLLASSSLGRPTTVANGTIQMGTDTFQSPHTLTYTGTGEITDRVLNINGNGSSTMTISQSGSGLLKFTSAVTKSGSATNYTPIVLTGAGNGEFATGLPGFGNFTKSGNGTWTIGGAYGSASATGTAGVKTISAGTLVFRAGGLNPTGNTTISGASTAFIYNAASDAILTIGGSATSTFTLTGGTNTTIGGSIGSTTSSARINVAGNTTASATGNIKVNIYGINGVAPVAGTNNYVLLQSNATATNSLDGANYTLGTVYNNTNFTVGGTIGETTTTVTASITQAAALTGNVYWKGGLTGNTAVWAASNGSTDSNWATDVGGTATPLVPGSGANVVIATTTPTTSPTATTLGSDMSINSLTISNTVGLGLNASGVDSYKLTVGTGGITMGSSTAASTIAVPVGLGGNQIWTNSNSTNALTVSGIVSGSGTLTIAGSGTVNLNGANIYSGTTTVSSGATAKLGSIIALGTIAANTTISSGGTIDLNGQTIAEAFNTITGTGVGGNGALINSSATAATTSGNIVSGAFTVGGTGNINISGAITSSGTITKIGANTLTLSGLGNNNSVGLTVSANGGTVVLGKVTTAGGTHALGANSSVGSNATIQLGGTGDFQLYGGVSLTVASGGVFDLNGRNQDWNSTGAFPSDTGNLNLNGTGISSGGALINSASGTTSTLTLGNTPASGTPGSIVLQSNSSIGGVGNIVITGGTSVNGAISGANALTKVGAGTLTLSSASTYSGTTTVSEGTLIVNGSINSTTTVTVATGATLGGSGSVGGAITINGTLSPGTSPGQLSVANSLVLSNGSLTLMELGGATLGTGYDNISLNAAGALVYGGGLNVVNFGGYDMNLTSLTYDLFSLNGMVPTGDFFSVTVNSVPLTNNLGVWTGSGSGVTYEFNQSIGDLMIAIPEPNVAALLGSLGAVLLLRRRR